MVIIGPLSQDEELVMRLEWQKDPRFGRGWGGSQALGGNIALPQTPNWHTALPNDGQHYRSAILLN